MPRTATRIALAAAALAATHCSDDGGTPAFVPDTGVDATADATGDTNPDAAGDTGADAEADAPLDVVSDADTSIDTDPSDADAADGTLDGSGDIGPAFARIGGSTSGTAFPAELALSLDGEQVEVLITDPSEPFMFEAEVELGTPFTVSVLSHPYVHLCEVNAPSETADGDVDVDVTCVAGNRLTASSSQIADGRPYRAIERVEALDGGFRSYSFASWGPGVDDLPFTFDDFEVEGRITDFYFDGFQGAETEFVHAGDDATPWTEDDLIAEYNWFESHESGWRVRAEVVTDAGPDGLWRTDDDVRGPGSERGVVVEGLRDGAIDCAATWDVGLDGVLDTDDDELDEVRWRHTEYNPALDASPSAWLRVGVGDDDIPCTDDDLEGELEAPTRFISEDRLRVYILTLEGYRESVFRPDGTIWRAIEYKTDGGDIEGPDVDRVDSYTEYLVTETGDSRRIQVDGAGRDGTWFTADDEVHTADSYSAVVPMTGEFLLFVTYAGEPPLQGTDGAWGTRDDRASRWDIRTESETMQCGVSHTDAGPDGLWDETDCGNGTNDDTIVSVAWNRLDEQGRVIESCTSVGPGDDGIWTTDDDILDRDGETCSQQTWLDDFRYVRTFLEDVGPDGIPFSDDDTLRLTYLYEVDEYGGNVFEARVEGPGDDETWFTTDDGFTVINRWTRDRFQQQTSRTIVDGPGPDGVWLTEDDAVSRHDEYERIDRRFTRPR